MIDLKWTDLRNLNAILLAAKKLLSSGKGPGSYLEIAVAVKFSGKDQYKKRPYDDQLSRIVLEHHLCAQLLTVVSGLAKEYQQRLDQAVNSLERELRHTEDKDDIKRINSRVRSKKKYWSSRISEIEQLERKVKDHVRFLKNSGVAA